MDRLDPNSTGHRDDPLLLIGTQCARRLTGRARPITCPTGYLVNTDARHPGYSSYAVISGMTVSGTGSFFDGGEGGHAMMRVSPITVLSPPLSKGWPSGSSLAYYPPIRPQSKAGLSELKRVYRF